MMVAERERKIVRTGLEGGVKTGVATRSRYLLKGRRMQQYVRRRPRYVRPAVKV